MWGAGHTLMIFFFGSLALFLAFRNSWGALGAAFVSQIPFWVGSIVSFVNGDYSPVGVNMCMNIIAAGVFVEWAHRLQHQGNGGVIHIWISLIFLAAASLDVIQLVHEFESYILAQEAIHYIALLTIGGRAYVENIDRNHRNSGNSGNAKQSGRLV